LLNRRSIFQNQPIPVRRGSIHSRLPSRPPIRLAPAFAGSGRYGRAIRRADRDRPVQPRRRIRPKQTSRLGPPRTVLKSGVIEGMAYTLYSDGAIEADLKQGMVRFSSIDDLRRHLAAHE